MSTEPKHLRIASPCPASWEGMKGDERVRFCDLCNLHVYNLAELTRTEAASLLAKSEGRICARLYQRADGTVITKDCPVGLRAIRRRVAGIAGAVFATLISLGSVVIGQKQNGKDKSSCKQQITITRKTSQTSTDTGVLAGTVLDPIGAVIPGARIAIFDRKTKTTTSTESSNDGEFRISGLSPSVYDVVIEDKGFKKLTATNVTLSAKEIVSLQLVLQFDSATFTVGLLMDAPMIEPPGRLVINENMIQRIPR